MHPSRTSLTDLAATAFFAVLFFGMQRFGTEATSTWNPQQKGSCKLPVPSISILFLTSSYHFLLTYLSLRTQLLCSKVVSQTSLAS